jgi:membrane protease YdiL (CAAX protease family)
VTPGKLYPLIGTAAALAITTAMDATGYSMFSALPLFPLMALFWYVQRLSRKEVGFVWGRRSDYVAAVLYPVLVLGAATAIALAAGAVDVSETNWQHFWLNLVAGGLSTILVVAITEEGFFRGWLWASLERTGSSPVRTLLWTSLAFSAWHLSAVLLDTGFAPPREQVPVFLVNGALLGLIWGMLRLSSGSVLVASVSHGLWNGLNYALFAFGTEVGALGITQTGVFGPEVGLVGLALNGLYALLFWRWIARHRPRQVQASTG